MKVSEAFEAFEIDELLSENRSQKTIDSYRSTLNSLLHSLQADLPLTLLTYGHIIAWKKYMHDRNNSAAHMALQLRELRRILSYLKSHGFSCLDPSEIKIPHFTYRKTAWFNLDEVRRFLSVIADPRDLALFGSMFGSGARISEILSLNRDSIVNGIAEITGKGNTPGTLSFDTNALSLIDAYLATRKDDNPALFISRQNRRICVQQCIRLTHKYIEKAGIQKNGRGATHILRHSFGSNLELNGLDLHGIATQMRHKKLETTKIYLHGAEQRKVQDYANYHTPTPID